MKALVKTKAGQGNVELMDVPEPSCSSAKDVKIEVKFTGICGTDLHVYYDHFKNYPPVILGHEFSGIVAEVGEAVKNIRAGDRVTVLPSIAVICGSCEYCRSGFYNFCSIRRGMGHGVNGSFTKYVIVREEMVYKIPDFLTLEEAALSEPFACAVQAMEELTCINAGDVVLLSGPGPIGLLCLQLLLAHKCKIIVSGTSIDEQRLKLAKDLGADLVIDVIKENLVTLIDKETNGKGVDVAIEAAGAAPSVANCLISLKKMGKYIQVGLIGKEIAFNMDYIFYKQLQLYGSLGHSYKTWDRVMRIYEQRKIDLKPLITHKLPLSRWREGFDICEKKQGVKILISYDE